MANTTHVEILSHGVTEWNAWRKANPIERPDLVGFDFTKIKPIYWEDSSGHSHSTQLWELNLSGCDMRAAILTGRELLHVNLSHGDLENAVLNDALIKMSDLRHANLRHTNLKGARLILVDLRNADLSGAAVFGISAWDTKLENADQRDLILTPPSVPTITVDNLQVAQFVYSLIQNKTVGPMIDGLTSSIVLILGRFTPERKPILDALRERLRDRNYVPVLFDFEKPSSRDLTETVSLIAHMARFVIADLTDPRSIPQELTRIIPLLPSVPIKPLLLASQQEYGMFTDFRAYPWVLEPYLYENQLTLLAELSDKVIAPAEAKAKELTETRSQLAWKKS